VTLSRWRALVTAAFLAGALAACTDTATTPEVSIELKEFSISVDPKSEDEGGVRIFVDNEGTLEHSLVFAQASDPADLPLTLEGSVDLSRALISDRLEAVGPGRYRIKPSLLPGPLIVFCNLVTAGPDGQTVSHFQRGMRAKLAINRTTSATTAPPP
jgi:hypothetical protein